jgi:hypothetical protein
MCPGVFPPVTGYFSRGGGLLRLYLGGGLPLRRPPKYSLSNPTHEGEMPSHGRENTRVHPDDEGNSK